MPIDPNKTLFISDDFVFYTLEGEGRYIGYPSVFMRMAMCNLTCIGFKSEDSPHGCDSYISWSKKNKMTFEEIAQLFEKNEYHERLREGALLKLTGGEPFIQQKSLIEFVNLLEIAGGLLTTVERSLPKILVSRNYILILKLMALLCLMKNGLILAVK